MTAESIDSASHSEISVSVLVAWFVSPLLSFWPSTVVTPGSSDDKATIISSGGPLDGRCWQSSLFCLPSCPALSSANAPVCLSAEILSCPCCCAYPDPVPSLFAVVSGGSSLFERAAGNKFVGTEASPPRLQVTSTRTALVMASKESCASRSVAPTVCPNGPLAVKKF